MIQNKRLPMTLLIQSIMAYLTTGTQTWAVTETNYTIAQTNVQVLIW